MYYDISSIPITSSNNTISISPESFGGGRHSFQPSSSCLYSKQQQTFSNISYHLLLPSSSNATTTTTTSITTSTNPPPRPILSETEHLESFQCALALNECCKRRDWKQFGNLLSNSEVDKGISELQQKYDKQITRMDYVSVFIPRLMKSTNRGKYNDLVDFEFRREFIVSELEVIYVFNYIYQVKQMEGASAATRSAQQNYSSSNSNRFEEEETLWVTRESRNHCWKVQFFGTPFPSSSHLSPQCCVIL
ncbi:hypothetical protein C9374_013460 [Naegleria lovaniensis]|uniref:Uncharacterized protein n=1 Tax=Naegleria lovaniensis TaxID=51637 RepID=A0AA88KVJ3_NAELO|nr:uncharacterized protein C9374_013460 [Naegleria lovaniensis]KAG2391975.1 hypothetical protein C9374_013460 [Naegleria lovaniensis]